MNGDDKIIPYTKVSQGYDLIPLKVYRFHGLVVILWLNVFTVENKMTYMFNMVHEIVVSRFK